MTDLEFLELTKRLATYPGAHPNETWKMDKDLTHCTAREKEELRKLGITISMCEAFELDRGQVAHILVGYRYAGKRG